MEKNEMFENMVDLYNLNKDAISEGGELNPLAYKEGDYASLDVMLGFLQKRKDEDVSEANLAQMSINGRVMKDSFDEYLSNPATSSSALKQVLKTPLHYFCYMNDKVVKQPKKSFEMGTFCHLAFLEPERFDTLIVEPNASRSSNEGIATLTKFWEKQAKAVGKKNRKKILFSSKKALEKSGFNAEKMDGKKFYIEELQKRTNLQVVDEQTKLIIDLIKRHYYTYGGGIIPKLLKGACFETSFYGLDKETGIPIKVRPDAFNTEENCGANVLISFKTTSADSIGKFWNDAAKYGYEISEAMYLELMSHITERKFNAVVTIMLQTVPPYLPAVFWWKTDDLQLGKYKFRTAMTTLKECLESNSFPGYEAFAEPGNRGIIEVGLPTYAFKELLPMGVE